MAEAHLEIARNIHDLCLRGIEALCRYDENSTAKALSIFYAYKAVLKRTDTDFSRGMPEFSPADLVKEMIESNDPSQIAEMFPGEKEKTLRKSMLAEFVMILAYGGLADALEDEE